MATDIQKILNNLVRFYDFSGKKVLHIGAGGGQFLLNPEFAGEIITVDFDPVAVRTLKAIIKQKNLTSRVKVMEKDFYDLQLHADAVLFEFCLHEMSEPLKAVKHACSLAGDIVIMDHSPDSRWAWYVCETDKAAAAWQSAGRCGMQDSRTFNTIQYFETYQDLLEKVKMMGEESIRRIAEFMNLINIRIPMTYQIGLIKNIKE